MNDHERMHAGLLVSQKEARLYLDHLLWQEREIQRKISGHLDRLKAIAVSIRETEAQQNAER